MNLPAVLVLALLVVEMLAFTILVMPKTNSLRHKLITAFNTPVAAKGLHAWRISLIFVTILFADGVRSVVQKQEVATDVTVSQKLAASKLVAQRNLYLCGFSMYLAFAIWRVEALLRELDVTIQSGQASKSTAPVSTKKAA